MAKIITYWLKCKTTPGMFGDESFIEVRIGEEIITGIFPNTMVREGQLKVVVLKTETDGYWVTVPTANGYGFFGASSLWVNKEMIVSE